VDSFTFNHDPRKGPFALTGPERKTEHFCDRPAKYVVVEPDTETGEWEPVLNHDKLVVMYLCRRNARFR
jgi:hypothetical protein